MTAIRQLTQFTPDDDLLHDEVSASGPYARESLLLTAPIPDEQLLVFLYLWREGGTKWGRFVFVAGPDMNDPLFLSHADDADYSGENLRDFTVGGLHWRQPKPLTTAEVEFQDKGVELALRFEGIHAPFSWHDNADGCPDWAAHNRFEQSGLTQGSLTLGDRHVEFTGVGHRDHSWGSRNWNMLQHWKWINAATPDGASSLHAMIMWVKGETLINGYLDVNGQVSPIVSAEASADLDDNMVHRAARGRFVDEQGREMTFESRYSAGWSMPIQHLDAATCPGSRRSGLRFAAVRAPWQSESAFAQAVTEGAVAQLELHHLLAHDKRVLWENPVEDRYCGEGEVAAQLVVECPVHRRHREGVRRVVDRFRYVFDPKPP